MWIIILSVILGFFGVGVLIISILYLTVWNKPKPPSTPSSDLSMCKVFKTSDSVDSSYTCDPKTLSGCNITCCPKTP